MNHRVVLTGPTGAIGSYLLHRLSHRPDCQVTAVFSKPASVRRLRAMEPGINWDRVVPLHADLRSDEDFRAIVAALTKAGPTVIVHAAADVSWTKAETVLDGLNVGAAVRMAGVAAELATRPSFVMFSTAYAHRENGAHLNGYEATKRRAEEEVVRRYAGSVPIGIIRPSLVVGDSQTGWIGRFNGLYPLIRLVAFGEVPCLLGERDYRLDLVPVDWVADDVDWLIARLTSGEAPRRPLVVTTAASDEAPTFGECLDHIQDCVNSYRAECSLPPLPPTSILRRRQFDFLMRAAGSWDLAHRFEHARRVSEVMTGYVNQSEASIRLEPTIPRSYVAGAAGLLRTVTRYWLDVNRDRVLSQRNMHWRTPDHDTRVPLLA